MSLEQNEPLLEHENILQDSPEIETEDKGNEESLIPFDPNSLKIRSQAMTVGQLTDRLEYDEIEMLADFQRLPNLWDKKRQSRLIESILLKLPLPSFYFDEQKEEKWNVIDGLQRISAFKNFVVEKTLSLENMEFLTDLNGKKYEELPRDLQRRISTFPINVYILEKETPEVIKYLIFQRLNQSALLLKPQEIRNAVFQGKISQLLKELVSKETLEGQAFIKATDDKIPDRRMEDRDFIARFIGFYVSPYSKYEPDLDSFLNKALTVAKKLTDAEIAKLKADFRLSMQTAFEIFGTDAFRKRYALGEPRKPINKALFEAMSVSFAKLNEQEHALLRQKKQLFRNKLILLMHDEGFGRALTQGTAQKGNVVNRHENILKIIQETLKSDDN